MRSPVMALAWEIWRQNRRPIWLVVGITSFFCLVNQAIPEKIRVIESYREMLLALDGMMMALSLLLVYGIFNYTESNPRKEWSGFPYRLFVLPVTTLLLVAFPMFLGVVSVILTYWAWAKLVFTHAEIPPTWWFPVVLGVFMVVYQAILWSLAGFRIIRIIVLGLAGPIFVFFAVLPLSMKDASGAPGISEKFLMAAFAGVAFITFLAAWASVARQRSGGIRSRTRLFRAILERIMDALPRRRKGFASPAAAQFWFEWRRSGWLLPMCAGAVLALLGPLSWMYRDDPTSTTWTLAHILALPLVFATAIGLGFSRPDFWSLDGSLKTFIATRPLASGELVVTKMKVAALSVALAWLLVLVFIPLWLGSWANTSQLNKFLLEFRMYYPHSWHAILILSVAGLILMTWRSLVCGMWAGLAGSWKPFIVSASVKLTVMVVVGIGCAWSGAHEKWRDAHTTLLLSLIGWALAIAVISKLWAAVFIWKQITPNRVRKYLLIWSGTTIFLVALAVLATPSFDIYRFEHLLVLGALLPFPFARLGLAPLSLAKNRHR